MSKRVACGNNRYQPKSSPQYWCTLVDAGSDTAGREHSERAAPWTTGSDSLTRSNRPGRFSGQFYAFQHGAGRPLALRISGQLSLAEIGRASCRERVSFGEFAGRFKQTSKHPVRRAFVTQPGTMSTL